MNITNDVVTSYINSFYKPLNRDLGALREDAEANNVPIILKETETFLGSYLTTLKPKKILEIGCAIGYSAMFFSTLLDAEVLTIEKDENRYIEANNNIKKFGFEKKISILLGDGEEALNDYLKEKTEKFDLVFIDAAKSHYKRFFDASLKYLNEDGVIIADNVLFKARIASDEYDPLGKYKTNIKKLREFNEYIMNDKRYISSIIAVGDGLSITKLK